MSVSIYHSLLYMYTCVGRADNVEMTVGMEREGLSMVLLTPTAQYVIMPIKESSQTPQHYLTPYGHPLWVENLPKSAQFCAGVRGAHST